MGVTKRGHLPQIKQGSFPRLGEICEMMVCQVLARMLDMEGKVNTRKLVLIVRVWGRLYGGDSGWREERDRGSSVPKAVPAGSL